VSRPPQHRRKVSAPALPAIAAPAVRPLRKLSCPTPAPSFQVRFSFFLNAIFFPTVRKNHKYRAVYIAVFSLIGISMFSHQEIIEYNDF
jgi:hypothetical protein